MARKFTFRLDSEGVEKLRKDLEALGPAGDAAFKKIQQSSPQLVDALKRAEEQAANTRQKLDNLGKDSGPLKALAAGADEVTSKFNSFAGRIPVVGSALQALGPAGTAAAAGLGLASALLVKGATEAAEYERSLNRLQAVLRATGQSSGLTAGQLAGLADQIEGTTLATEEGALDAAAALATFRSVTGSTFIQTLKLSQDLAAVFGGDLRSSAVQLGKALEDPIQGLTALRRVGVSFSDAQKETIKTLVESGQHLEAQRMILRAVEQQVGGAGEGERTGTTGAIKNLRDAWNDYLKDVARGNPVIELATAGMNKMAGFIKGLRETPDEELARLDESLAGVGGIDPRADDFMLGGMRRRQGQLRSQIRGGIRDSEDAAEGAERGAAGAAAEAEAERLAARKKALDEIATAQERLIEINKKAIAQRAEEAAADEAVAKVKEKLGKLAPEEEKAIRQRAILAVQAKKAVEDEVEADKKRIQFTERVLDALRELDEKRDEAFATVDRQVEGLKRETEVLGIDEGARRVLVEVMQAENTLRAQGIDLQDEEAKARIANVRAAAEEQEAKRKVVDAQKKAAEDAKREARQATDDVVRYTADRMADLFSNTSGGWKRMWENMKQTAISMAARIGAEAVVRPVVTPIVNSIFGVSGGGSGGGTNPLGGILNMFDSGGGGGSSGGTGGGLGQISSFMPNPSSFFGSGSGPSMISQIGQSIGGLFGTGAGAGGAAGFGYTGLLADVAIDGTYLGGSTSAVGLSGAANGIMGAIPVWGWISLAATILKQFVGGSDPRSAGGVINTLLAPSLSEWMADPMRSMAVAANPIGTAIGDIIGNRTIAGILNPLTLFGKKPGFSGGQVNLGVDDNGNLIPTQAGFKRYDGDEAIKATKAFADGINMLFDQLGLSLTPGGANLGNLAFGQTTQTVNDTLGMILKGGRLTADSPELLAKIQGMSLEGTSEEVLTRLTDLVTIFRLLNDVATDGTLNPEPLTQTEQVLKAINEKFDDLSKKAEQFGYSVTDLENARDKAISDLTTGFNRSVELQLLSITNPFKEVMERLKDSQDARLKEAKAAGADLVMVEKLSAAERKKVLEQINQPIVDLLDSMTLGQGILSPREQLKNAESRFNSLRGDVLGGDYSKRDDLAQAAQQLDEISRSSFASGSEYIQRREFIMATLRNVLGIEFTSGTGLLNAPGAAPPFKASGSGLMAAGASSAAMTTSAPGAVTAYEQEMVTLATTSSGQLAALLTEFKDLSARMDSLASSINLLARAAKAA